VQELCRARSERGKPARPGKENGGKQIAAVMPGLSQSYLLSGLMVCGHFDRSRTVSSSPAYMTVSGETNRYPNYVCPRRRRGRLPQCHARAGELAEGDGGRSHLLEQIQQELNRSADEHHDARPALETQRSQLGMQAQGWLLSLFNPDMSPTVRSLIERDTEEALRRHLNNQECSSSWLRSLNIGIKAVRRSARRGAGSGLAGPRY
jgi:hypothetical protein